MKVRTVLALVSLMMLAFTLGLSAGDAVAEDETSWSTEYFPVARPLDTGLIFNQTDISGQALSGATGVVGVNMAAGDDNTQVNARAVVMGGNALTISGIGVNQSVNLRPAPGVPSYHLDYIGGGALAGSQGIISINQTAGSGSAQANLVSIGLGGGEVALASSSELLSSYGDIKISPQGYQGVRSDVIEGQAFSGCQGLVQVNQSAGSANRVLNAAAIQYRVIDIQ